MKKKITRVPDAVKEKREKAARLALANSINGLASLIFLVLHDIHKKSKADDAWKQ